MGLFEKLFGTPPNAGRDQTPKPSTVVAPPNLGSGAGQATGLRMHPEPWTLAGLPPGLASTDFNNGAVALTSLRPVGRVIPLPATPIRARALTGVHYPHNVARVRAGLRMPCLTDLSHLVGQRNQEPRVYLPGFLWADGSEADGIRPLACIGPTGYFGSLWDETLGARLHRVMTSEARRGRLLAVPLAIDPEPDRRGVHEVRMLVPDLEKLDRFGRWLTTPAAADGKPFERPVVASAWLRRLADYQDDLNALLGEASVVEVNVRLTLESTAKGKYAGQNMVKADVLGRTVGVLPAQYREDCPEFFDAVESGATNGSAEITRYPERTAVRVTLHGE